MSDELLGAVVGGAIGIVAALLGSAITFGLTVIHERRKERAGRNSALQSCLYEAAGIASTLHTVGPSRTPVPVALERVINSGYLGEVSPDAARQLLLFRTLLYDLNNTLAMVENLSFSAIAAGNGSAGGEAVVAFHGRATRVAKSVVEQSAELIRILRGELGSAPENGRLTPPLEPTATASPSS